MKTRGTRKGILLSLEPNDSVEAFEKLTASDEYTKLFSNKVVLEVSEKLPWPLVNGVVNHIEDLGGEVLEIRPPGAMVQTKSETVIVSRTIRSGSVIEASGSAIILGDVNAGAQIVAEGDIIVIGKLRGTAHAGALGNENALIWAQQIMSPQLRIAGAFAQGDGSSGESATGEVAVLKNEQIIIKPWDGK